MPGYISQEKGGGKWKIKIVMNIEEIRPTDTGLTGLSHVYKRFKIW